MRLNKRTAELCGIILGDGNLHKRCNRITISGSSDDLLYFQSRVIPLFRKCFKSVNPRIVQCESRNACNLEIENITIFNFFIEKFGLRRGPKNNASIPKVIISNPLLIPHFLRGLFDTDGCLKFSKQARSYSYYPRIRFAFVSSPLAHELNSLLQEVGFISNKHVKLNHGYKTTKDLVTYEISGKAALEKWMQIVSPANPVQIAKYLYWKKFGRHEPYMSFTDRVSKIGPGGFEPPSMGPKPTILGRYTTGLLPRKR